MRERVRPVDGCSPDAWCAQSDVFVWWTRAFYAARGHAPRVSFVRPAVCSPAAARVVVFMRSCCLSCASLTVLKRTVCLLSRNKSRFPPPHVSKCKMASFPSFPGEDSVYYGVRANASGERGVMVILSPRPMAMRSVRPPTHRLSGLETNRHVEAVVHTRGQYM
jgi:hypothetical protein